MNISTMLFVVLALVILGLPFIPMFFEIIKNTDAKPSEILSTQAVDPRQDAEAVLWYHVFQLEMDSVEELAEILKVSPTRTHASGVRLLQVDSYLQTAIEEPHALTEGPLKIGSGIKFRSKILSLTHIEAGDENQFLELHARERLTLGAGNKVLWWASASEVWVGPDANLTGKISGKIKVRLEDRTRFHLLDSPWIQFGSPELRNGGERFFSPNLGVVVERKLHRGDLEIPSGLRVDGNLVVRGKLTLGEGVRVFGSIKAHGKLVIGKSSEVHGSVFCQRDIEMREFAYVGGPVGSEGQIAITRGCQIGSRVGLTSVVAPHLVVLGVSQIHGTVRTWKLGEVKFEAGNKKFSDLSI